MKVLFDFQDALEVVSVYNVQELGVNPTEATLVHSMKTCGETISN
jgi:hypothetical protein